MKKMIIPFMFVMFLIVGLITSSCTPDCANCKIYTINRSVTPHDTENVSAPEEYCGEDLDAVDGKSDIDNQDIETVYVCD